MLRCEELISGIEKLLIETNTTIPQLKILRTPSHSLGIISKNSSMKLFGFKVLVRTRFESLAQKIDGLRPKKPKTMNL